MLTRYSDPDTDSNPKVGVLALNKRMKQNQRCRYFHSFGLFGKEGGIEIRTIDTDQTVGRYQAPQPQNLEL